MARLLSKDQILGHDFRQYREVDVPEWKLTVRLSTMTSAERDAFEAQFVDAKGKGKAQSDSMRNFRARFVARCLVDDDGNVIFKGKDVDELGNQPAPVLNRLFDIARELNGMTEQDVKDIEGNSGGDQPSDS